MTLPDAIKDDHPVMATDEIDIRPLTATRLDDLRALFDQGGDPKVCQCAFWRVPSTGWGDWTRDHNRTALEEPARRRPAAGLVAFARQEAVGWVSVGPRTDYVRLERSKALPRIDDEPVWSIVCFVVGRRFRGRGVATKLLDAAIDHARSNGASIVEAYPVDAAAGRVPAATAYMGPLSMYEQAGFQVVRRHQWRPSAAVRPIVRLEL